MLTMQGGFDTTGSAISSALLYLDRDRDARQRLIDEPDLMAHRGRGVPARRAPRSSRSPAPPSATSRSAAARSPRATGCCSCGRRATATRTVFERRRRGGARPLPEPAHGVRPRRPPLPRLDVRPPPDPRRAARRCCAGCPTTRSTTRGSCGPRRSASRTARSRCRSRSRPASASCRDARPGRSTSRSPTPTSTSGTTRCPGMRWLFLEPDFEHPRLKGTQRLDAPRYTPAELRRRGRRRGARQGRPHPVRDAADADPTQETDWLDALADEHGLARRDRRRMPAPRARRRRACSPPTPRRRASAASATCRCTGAVDARRGAPARSTPPPSTAASVELMVPIEHYDSIAALAERWPTSRSCSVTPASRSSATPSYLARWSAALAELAGAAPNVVLKVSAIASSADPAWTVDSIRPWVLAAIEAFGADRCMLASNWPIDRLYGTYDRLVAAYREIVAELAPTPTAPPCCTAPPTASTASDETRRRIETGDHHDPDRLPHRAARRRSSSATTPR